VLSENTPDMSSSTPIFTGAAARARRPVVRIAATGSDSIVRRVSLDMVSPLLVERRLVGGPAAFNAIAAAAHHPGE
jgi:hypothetical protein